MCHITLFIDLFIEIFSHFWLFAKSLVLLCVKGTCFEVWCKKFAHFSKQLFFESLGCKAKNLLRYQISWFSKNPVFGILI